MLLIHEVFHCRPGKVRPLLEKFQAMNRIMANAGQGNMRLMTDFSGERYWTLVAEFETPGMAEFEKMMQGEGMSEADTKEFERLMEGYHDLIDSGHRSGWSRSRRGDRSRTWRAGNRCCPCSLGQAPVASKDLVELPLFKLFQIQQGVVRPCGSAKQFVQLHLHGLGITVLGSLNEEYHQERDDGRPRIDHQLPGIAEPKQWAHQQPSEDHAHCKDEGRGPARHPRRRLRKATKPGSRLCRAHKNWSSLSWETVPWRDHAPERSLVTRHTPSGGPEARNSGRRV